MTPVGRGSVGRALIMIYTVYVLKDSRGKLYKGCTNNLGRRLLEHRAGKTRTTKVMMDLAVVYTETFVTWEEARKREVYFKSAAGRRFLKNKLHA